MIISRADDFPDEPVATREKRDADSPEGGHERTPADRTIESLEARIKLLEAGRQKDPDAVQRKLLLNLDILTKAEQRSDGLRKQLIEMIEKENSIQTRLDAIEIDLRPELIERSVAGVGSLRPEELREARRRQLTSERTNLQNLIAEIRRNRATLETNLNKADELVERLRVRLEREIDTVLSDEEKEKPQDKP